MNEDKQWDGHLLAVVGDQTLMCKLSKEALREIAKVINKLGVEDAEAQVPQS